MTAAFWSRFKRFLLSRSYGCRGSWGVMSPKASASAIAWAAEGWYARLGGRSLRVNKVTGARRVDFHAGAHRRGHHDGAQIASLCRGRLGADELLHDRLVVREQMLVRERGLADRHVHDGGAVGAVLDLACLG